MPDAIFLFGSASRGEDKENSDIDIYVKLKSSGINTESFEKQLRRKINILFEENFKELSPELKNNIVNGIKLKGYLDLFKNENSDSRQKQGNVNSKDVRSYTRKNKRHDKTFP